MALLLRRTTMRAFAAGIDLVAQSTELAAPPAFLTSSDNPQTY